MKKNKKEKIRINITVDSDLLKKAKKKLSLFGGKLSTLFNAYLNDFVDSIEKQFSKDQKTIAEKIKDLEARIKKIESGKK